MFESMDQLFGWLENLRTGSEWQSTVIDIKGLETMKDAHLIWSGSSQRSILQSHIC